MILKGILTIEEIAKRFGVTEETVDKWRDLGMPTIKLGKMVLVIEKRFISWLSAMETVKKSQ